MDFFCKCSVIAFCEHVPLWQSQPYSTQVVIVVMFPGLDCQRVSRALTQATAVFGRARGACATVVATLHKATDVSCVSWIILWDHKVMISMPELLLPLEKTWLVSFETVWICLAKTKEDNAVQNSLSNRESCFGLFFTLWVEWKCLRMFCSGAPSSVVVRGKYSLIQNCRSFVTIWRRRRRCAKTTSLRLTRIHWAIMLGRSGSHIWVILNASVRWSSHVQIFQSHRFFLTCFDWLWKDVGRWGIFYWCCWLLRYWSSLKLTVVISTCHLILKMGTSHGFHQSSVKAPLQLCLNFLLRVGKDTWVCSHQRLFSEMKKAWLAISDSMYKTFVLWQTESRSIWHGQHQSGLPARIWILNFWPAASVDQFLLNLYFWSCLWFLYFVLKKHVPDIRSIESFAIGFEAGGSPSMQLLRNLEMQPQRI